MNCPYNRIWAWTYEDERPYGVFTARHWGCEKRDGADEYALVSSLVNEKDLRWMRGVAAQIKANVRERAEAGLGGFAIDGALAIIVSERLLEMADRYESKTPPTPS